MGAAAVSADPLVAKILARHGAAVVLCGPDAAGIADTLIALRATGARVAAFVGDLSDPEVEAAALAMAGELFGGEAVTVRTESDARQHFAGAPGSEREGSGTV